MKLNELLKKTRESLFETQTEFGKRFNVSATAISLWESGARDIPNNVVENLINNSLVRQLITCPRCSGAGVLFKEIKQEYKPVVKKSVRLEKI